jgi:hypothetical protein
METYLLGLLAQSCSRLTIEFDESLVRAGLRMIEK